MAISRYVRRAVRAANRYAPYARMAVKGYRMYRQAKSAYNSGFTTSSRVATRVKSGTGVTTQYDAKTVYRRKRMPRKKKKQWRKFVKKVHAAQDSQIATRSVILNNQLQIGGVGNTTQTYGSISLYGWRGTNALDNVGSSDIQDIRLKDANTDGAAERYKFITGVLDITANNIGGTDLEVDVYEIGYTGRGVLNNASLQAEYIQALANTPTQPGGSGGAMTAPTITSRGWTPFNCSLASIKGFKIYKKKKYLLAQGNTFTYQVRDPKAHWVDGNDIQVPGEFAKKGLTKLLFFIIKPVTGAVGDTYEMVVGATRSYHYKIYQDNTHYEGQI